jgi:hypothetical protein
MRDFGVFGCTFSADSDCVLSPADLYVGIGVLLLLLAAAIWGFVSTRRKDGAYEKVNAVLVGTYLVLMIGGALLMLRSM